MKEEFKNESTKSGYQKYGFSGYPGDRPVLYDIAHTADRKQIHGK
jgi:hypothetical protein